MSIEYDLTTPHVRVRCVPDTSAIGNGVELDDGRILYCYTAYDSGTATYMLRRGWAASITSLFSADDQVANIDTLGSGATWVAVSVSRVDNRLLMFVNVRGPSTLGSSAFFPGQTQGARAYESVDNGDTWTALGSVVGNGYGSGTSPSGFGRLQAPGQIVVDAAGDYAVLANMWRDYFGDAVNGIGLYTSTDSGATWTATLVSGSVYLEGWGRDIGSGATNNDLAFILNDGVPTNFNGSVVYTSSTGVAGLAFAYSYASYATFLTAGLALTATNIPWRYLSDEGQLTVYPVDFSEPFTTQVSKLPGSADLGPSIIYQGPTYVLFFHAGYADRGWPVGVSAVLAPLRIPWPRWPDDAYLPISPQLRDQEHQNHLAIDRWWSLTRKGFTSRLHVPFPRWAMDAGFKGGSLEYENYLVLERWADRWNAVADRGLVIPHRRWGDRDDMIPRAWVEREQENYLAMERSVSASR